MTAPRAQVFGFATASPDEAQTILSAAYAPVRVVAPRAGLRLAVTGAECAGVGVFHTRCETGVVFESASSFDGYTLTSTIAGSQTLRSGHRDVAASSGASPGASSGSALVVDALDITQVRFGAGLDFQGLSIGSDALHAHLALRLDAPVGRRVQFASSLSADDPRLRVLHSLGQAMRDGLSGDAPLAQAPAALSSLREAILGMVVDTLAHSYTDRLNRRAPPMPSPRSVLRAIDFIHQHAEEPLTLADIAAAAGTSARSLQEAFRRFRECTPMEYLRRLRLQRAREDLLDPAKPGRVAPIAMRWGFAHLGLFSIRYRAAYGESPRDTLRRRPDVRE